MRPPKEKKLPVILTREEVQQLLSHVRFMRYRVCLFTIYSCGLRLSEGTHLQVSDIDSARMLIHIHHGKGASQSDPFGKGSLCAFATHYIEIRGRDSKWTKNNAKA